MRCVDLHIPAGNGQYQIVSFCFERSALSFARELGLTTYRIMIGSYVYRSEGVWPR